MRERGEVEGDADAGLVRQEWHVQNKVQAGLLS